MNEGRAQGDPSKKSLLCFRIGSLCELRGSSLVNFLCVARVVDLAQCSSCE
jgi:hypothetical protein